MVIYMSFNRNTCTPKSEPEVTNCFKSKRLSSDIIKVSHYQLVGDGVTNRKRSWRWHKQYNIVHTHSLQMHRFLIYRVRWRQLCSSYLFIYFLFFVLPSRCCFIFTRHIFKRPIVINLLQAKCPSPAHVAIKSRNYYKLIL